MIGPIKASDRLLRVSRYFRKKHSGAKRHIYKCRKLVSTKRLRVRGRFVTREQTLQLLGISMEDLTNNEELQKMLTEFGNDPNSEVKINSVVQNKQNQRAFRVQNLQALIHQRETRCTHGYKETCDCD
jgi:uncharacterized protein YneF (UPF0154 family)